MAIYHMQNINKYLSLFLLILGLYFIGFHKTSASYQIIYEASNHSKKVMITLYLLEVYL